MLNLKQNANESDHRFAVRSAKIKKRFETIADIYRKNGLTVPKQKSDELPSKYVDRVIRSYRKLLAEKGTTVKLKPFESYQAFEKRKQEKWSVSMTIVYSITGNLIDPSLDKFYDQDSGVWEDVPISYSSMVERRRPSETTYVVEFDHKPANYELEESYQDAIDAWYEENKQLVNRYNVVLYKYQGIMKQEPIHLENTNIKQIIMKQNINNNCVIELLHKRYDTPIEELEEYFKHQTTPIKVNQWCIDNQVPHYAFDLKDNAIYRTPCKSKKRALIYVIADEHINEINDKAKRSKLTKSKTLLDAKRTNQKKPTTDEYKEFPFVFSTVTSITEELKDSTLLDRLAKDNLINRLNETSGKYYTEIPLNYLFLLMTYHNRRPPQVTASNNVIYKINYKKLTIIYYSPEQKSLCESLGVPFDGKRISEIVHEHITVDMTKLVSKYNVQTYNMIKNANASPLHYNFDTYSKEYLNDNAKHLINFDIKRCYPYICENYQMPYLTSDMQFEEYDNTPKPGYWYVVYGNSLLQGRCNFVPYEMLELMNCEIRYQIKPNYTNELQTTYKKISQNSSLKLAGNMFIGLLARTNKIVENVIYTYSQAEIGYYAFLTKSHVNYLDFNNKRLYKTQPITYKDVNQFKYRFAYLQIIMISRVLCYKMYLEIKKSLKNCVPIQLNTDGILVLQKKRIDLKKYQDSPDLPPGSYRKKPISEFTYDIIKSTVHNDQEEVLKVPTISEITQTTPWNPDELAKQILELPGCLITGAPGCGKTELLKAMQKLQDQSITCTFTRLASTLIPNSRPLHDVFDVRTIDNFDIKDATIRYYRESVKCILVDECSMCNSEIYEALNLIKNNCNIKIYLFGDFNQFAPIGSSLVDGNNILCSFLTHGNVLKLDYQYRSNKDYIKKLLSNDYSDLKTSKTSTKFNIALCNSTVDLINDKCAKKYSDFYTNGCYIRFNKTTKIKTGVRVPKNLLAEVSFDGETVYICQKFNGDLALSLEYELDLETYKKLITNGNIVYGYCITAYKSQGITIREPYTVYEWNHKYFDNTAKYVAASRTSDKNLVYIRG